jgi:hypothetical protein
MDAFQRGVGWVLTAALAAFLIAAWILTAPLFRGGTFLGDLYRKRFNPEMK